MALAFTATVGLAACGGDGDNSTNPPPPPPPPPAGTLAFTAVSAGGQQTCGIVSGGAAYCWGGNSFGELGNGSTTDSPTPVAVANGLTFSSIAAGSQGSGFGFHSCGVTTTGAAYCWGRNHQGQLGTGTFDSTSVPVAVQGGLTFSSITAGVHDTCALTSTGEAYCWGDNIDGSVGNGTTGGLVTTPALVAGGLTWTQISAGNHFACAVATGGAAYCWGPNSNGELGFGGFQGRSSPYPVAGSLTFTQVSAGASHACGVSSGGGVYCWGRNGDGRLGTGDTTSSPVPVPVTGGIAFTSVSAGGSHTCGLVSGGAVYCWGQNAAGQLGNNSTTPSTSPVQVAAPSGVAFTSVSAGFTHACGVTTTSAVYCWGEGTNGRLGNGGTSSSSVPVLVQGSGQP